MTMTQNVLESLRRDHQHAERQFNAMSTALALVQMDPHAQGDLAIYLEGARQAAKANDAPSLKYAVDAIAELFTPVDMSRSISHEEFEARMRRMPGGEEAFAAVERAGMDFRKKYFALKAECAYRTIRELARAAGVSPTTIQAIENGGFTPQWRTLEGLCRAFNAKLPKGRRVSTDELRG